MALFKDPKSSAYVRDVLRNIAYAKPLKGLEPNRKAPTAPRFMCLDSSTGSPFYYLKGMIPYLFCTQPGAGQAFYIGEGSYIFLCPSYWQGQIAPTLPNCPPLFHNHWPDIGASVGVYSTYLLIHEMVHFYLGMKSLGLYTDPPEVYPLNDCVGLNPGHSRRNPQNYQYYVACKPSITHIAMT